MVERAGRNDPCPCGSGKKYKNCCLLKEQQKRSSLGGRKFTAKVISGGGVHKPQSQSQEQHKQPVKPAVDYNILMERSFGTALHAYEDKPPIPSNPSEYLVSGEAEGAQKE